MEPCVGCGRALAPEWKFCVHCGQPITASATRGDDEVPAAIRPNAADLEVGESDRPPHPGRYSRTFWVAIAMGVTGLVVIVFAVIQMATTNV